MIRRAVLLAALALFALPAVAAAQDRGLTAMGSGDAAVKPQNAKDNASIVTAVDAARTEAAKAAVADARKQAERLAAAAGVKLGAIVALEEVQSAGLGALGPFAVAGPAPPPAPFPIRPGGRAVPVPAVPYAPLPTPFGTDRYCANVRRSVFRRKDGKRRRTGSRQVRTCVVPPRVTTQVKVTFAIG